MTADLAQQQNTSLPELAVIGPDSYLTLHYRVALTSEDAIESDIVNTFDGKPATLQLGSGQLAEALEACLIGLPCGAARAFDLAAGAAFGARSPALIQKVSRAVLDAESESGADYVPGDVVEFNAPGGGRYAGVLKELNERYALFDFNHPLAGQPVRFEVKIIGVL